MIGPNVIPRFEASRRRAKPFARISPKQNLDMAVSLAGKIAADMQRQRTGLLKLRPKLTAALELEIREAGVKRNLPRSHWQRTKGDTRQLQHHKIANALRRPEFDLRGQARAQRLHRHLRRSSEHETGRLEQVHVANHGQPDTVGAHLQFDRHRGLFEHEAEQSPNFVDHRRERAAQILLPIGRKFGNASARRIDNFWL